MTSVLLVEDEVPVAKVMQRWLEPADFAVRRVASAEEAIEQMADDPAAVVVCDVGLPGRDGVWLARELTEKYPQSAVVLATGSASVPPVVSLRKGVVAYLVKPFRREQLRSAIEQGLDWVARETEHRARIETLEREVCERRQALVARFAALPMRSPRDVRLALERLYSADLLEHADRVSSLSDGVGARLGLSARDGEALALAGQIHEIGRLVMPASLLGKRDPLTHAERLLLERAPVETHALLHRHETLAPAAELILTMRERFGGFGYPRGLCADEIPLPARILGAADAYDTMLRERPGRPALSPGEAAMEMMRTAGGQFDPRVVYAMFEALDASTTH